MGEPEQHVFELWEGTRAPRNCFTPLCSWDLTYHTVATYFIFFSNNKSYLLYSLLSCSSTVIHNGFLEEIGAFAFANLSKVVEITITGAKHLAVIHKDAFWNLPKLRYLSITNTGLKRLPDFTKINSAAYAFVLYVYMWLSFLGLNELYNHLDVWLDRELIFLFPSSRSLMGNQPLRHIHSQAFTGAEGPGLLDISRTAVSTLPENMLHGLKVLKAVAVQNLKKLPRPKLFTQLIEANLTYPSHCCVLHHGSPSRPYCSLPGIEKEEPGFFREYCQTNNEVSCFPKPDAFNPCEDIMGFTYLRVLIWLISVLAIAGNLLVLTVLLSSHYKLTVPRFLMCHLAFADLCMGVYLLLIATMDTHTRSQYYNYGIDWQTGPGCTTAGFITVFASELSVYTLTAVTVERWHTITSALQVERHLRLRHARAIMAVGWLFALLAAMLPVVGVSSYSKVSICLPMDVETTVAQVYVVGLLLLNALAFLVMCTCYVHIYMTVRNPSFVRASADMRIAKRMAVLIFTDFLCMAPISFFAILAAFKLPLITLSHAKVLLVFFYPINSCANPFLYAFFTTTFKKDFFILASRFGCFKARAQMYRTEMSSPQIRVLYTTHKTTDATRNPQPSGAT
uniref:Follicle stimulating hormone receptor n=1 Tax=Scleropages formosus TaxID=113540 RepID=A0A8C9W1W1_SCLFO